MQTVYTVYKIYCPFISQNILDKYPEISVLKPYTQEADWKHFISKQNTSLTRTQTSTKIPNIIPKLKRNIFHKNSFISGDLHFFLKSSWQWFYHLYGFRTNATYTNRQLFMLSQYSVQYYSPCLTLPYFRGKIYPCPGVCMYVPCVTQSCIKRGFVWNS